jgi:hypothetical protein
MRNATKVTCMTLDAMGASTELFTELSFWCSAFALKARYAEARYFYTYGNIGFG